MAIPGYGPQADLEGGSVQGGAQQWKCLCRPCLTPLPLSGRTEVPGALHPARQVPAGLAGLLQTELSPAERPPDSCGQFTWGKASVPQGPPPTAFSAGAPAQHHPPGASYQGWGPATSKKGLIPILRNLQVRSIGLHLVARAGRGRTRAPARALLALRCPSLRQVLRAGGLGGGNPKNCR